VFREIAEQAVLGMLRVADLNHVPRLNTSFCKPVKLSFYAIVKNESKNLGCCLASVRPYVDEMIVVDTGSTDDTVAIAQQYGAKIGYFEWCNDFAAARNYALSLVSGDWVLTLDADEELVVRSSQFREGLMHPDGPMVYGLNRRDLYEIGDVTGGHHVRLFRNLPELQYRDRYHEQLQHVSGHPLSLGTMDVLEILHYGNSDDNILFKNLTRDIPILEEMRAEQGLDLWRLDCLARKYLKVNRPDKAQDCYGEALDRLLPHLIEGEPPQPFFWVPTLLEALGARAFDAEDLETARLICQRGLEWCPNHPPLNYLTGDLLLLLGFPRGALSYFEYCLHMGKEGTYYQGDPFPREFINTFPAYALGCAYLALKNWQEAIAAFTLALSFDPNHAQAQEQLAIARQHLHASQ
jgi:tetratricopeptide (TPR) repeat protein